MFDNGLPENGLSRKPGFFQDAHGSGVVAEHAREKTCEFCLGKSKMHQLLHGRRAVTFSPKWFSDPVADFTAYPVNILLRLHTSHANKLAGGMKREAMPYYIVLCKLKKSVCIRYCVGVGKHIFQVTGYPGVIGQCLQLMRIGGTDGKKMQHAQISE